MTVLYRAGLIFFSIILLSAGCSQPSNKEKNEAAPDQENTTAAENKEGISETVEDGQNDYQRYATEDPEEMVQLEPGPYSGDNYDLEAVKQLIDQFPEGAEKEEYFHRIVALVAEDYRPFYDFIQQVDTSFDGPTEQPDGSLGEMGLPENQRINVQILFDASGSMGAAIDGMEKMELAKDAVKSFLDELPEDVHVSLRAYGHKGTGSQEDKKLSCTSTEEVYPLGEYDEKKFLGALDQFSPAGWTPLAASIEAAQKDLEKQTGENVENIIYVVSDGVETCDGDPVQAAKKLNESDIQAVINIIGFDVDDEGQMALKKVAEAGKGDYATVRSQEEFKKFFEKQKQELRHEWLKWSNENTSSYLHAQIERVDELLKKEREMKDLTRIEQKRLEELLPYAYKKFFGDDRQSKTHASRRGRALRQYAFNTAYPLRKELRTKGYENRENVREKAENEREKLKEETE